MLTDLRIRNFKAWEDTEKVRLAPITVFFGTNSSGKSSLGQLLLLLKQTAESADRAQVLRTSDRDALVDVGDFRDFIHHHDQDRELEFELGWNQERPVEIEDVKDPDVSYSSSRLAFSATIFEPEKARERMRVRKFAYALDPGPFGGGFSAGMSPDPKKSTRYRLDVHGLKPLHNRGRAWALPAPSRFYGFPDEAVAYFQNTEFLPDLSLALERTLASISYLGPLRVNPERTYNWLGGAPADVGTAGEQTVQALLAANGRRLNLRHRQRLRSFQILIAEQLQALGLISDFEVVPIARNRPEHEVRVRVRGAADTVLLTDVGFGVSQVLPVVTQSFYAPRNSTILMEQPELHLHPSVQKELADFFIVASKAREESTSGKSVERRTQFLIESHSEHFLRRLQRRIAEGSVEPSHVALYFCEMKRGRSTIKELDVDLFGHIHNWPEDFFGDPMEDVAAQAEASLERQMNGESARP